MASRRDNDSSPAEASGGAPRDPAAESVDALLIGALYDELSPSEQRELTAHLARNSADGDALAQLTTTRDVSRSVAERGQFFAPVEPPSSLSALLMQEAARRRAPAKSPGLFAWLAETFRSVGRHPAMASAAAFAVVGVVVGGLYMRGQGAPVEQTAAVAPPAVTATAMNVPAAGAAGPMAAATPAAPPAVDQGEAQAAPAPQVPRSSANLEKAVTAQANEASGYTARLADTPTLGQGSHLPSESNSAFEVGDDGKARPGDGVVATVTQVNGLRSQATMQSGGGNAVATTDSKQRSGPGFDNGGSRDLDEAEIDSRRAKKAKGSTGDSIEVTTPEPDLKNIDGNAPAGAPSPNQHFAAAPVQAESGKDRATAPPPPPPAPPSQVAKPSPSPPPKTPKEAQSEDTGAASKLHNKLIALNTSGICGNANRVERDIADRYPRYYADAVESDSRLSPCRAEVARRRAEESPAAASKAAKAAPAKPTKPAAAADEPAVKK